MTFTFYFHTLAKYSKVGSVMKSQLTGKILMLGKIEVKGERDSRG